MLRAIVIICGILLGLLLAAMALASYHSALSVGLRDLTAHPWGVFILLDASVGRLFVAFWLALIEPKPWRAVLWIVTLLVLGHVVTLSYLLWRTCKVRRWTELLVPARLHG